MKDSVRKYSVILSFSIGLPLGLFAILFAILLPSMLTGEGLASIAFSSIFGKATIGLVISFIIALWFGAKKVSDDTLNKKKLLQISFNYSFLVNTIIWTVFVCIFLLENYREDSIYIVMLPIFAYLISLGLTTISIGLLIAYLVRQKAKTSLLTDI